ncbi:MAG: cell wall hydrolase [Alphaproteobacteria bacterium HGW-Alphaproteobacteria-13]|jgi:hypothetical protein|nr:MAG: cell wall hydrolase [Alphaproteobacteria bacterium HGW-Alphaproteobacteria-13]
MDRTKTRNRRALRRKAAGAALLLAAVILGLAAWWLLGRGPAQRGESPGRIPERAEAAVPAPPELPPLAYKPLTPDDALAENAALPFSTAPIERALPVVVPLTASAFAGRRSAIDCLTAAIYYEAAQESDAGKRGVAQVVLNRARHPAFPNSICGVVYQGAERTTGCQFTFTCDGSLARKPSRAGWDTARMIAIAAMSGRVEPSVGMATHYHADYVVPYWAASLAKIAQIDHHIFYRWSGGWGRRTAFTQPIGPEQFLDAAPIPDFLDFESDSLVQPPIAANSRPSSPIAADKLTGSLAPGDPGASLSSAARPSIKADEAAAKPAADMASGALRVE